MLRTAQEHNTQPKNGSSQVRMSPPPSYPQPLEPPTCLGARSLWMAGCQQDGGVWMEEPGTPRVHDGSHNACCPSFINSFIHRSGWKMAAGEAGGGGYHLWCRTRGRVMVDEARVGGATQPGPGPCLTTSWREALTGPKP